MISAIGKLAVVRGAFFVTMLYAPWLAGPVYAQGGDTSVLKLPQDIEFKGALSGPPQTVVLYGDPTKPGVFVSRVRFSAGWKDPPHWHPDEVRTVVVLSGTFYFGSGDKWDESKLKAYPAGTFYSEPSKAPHFTWAKDGEGWGDNPGHRRRTVGEDVHSGAIETLLAGPRTASGTSAP
jgi:quercetin dioxygenase-like cupin family protein